MSYTATWLLEPVSKLRGFDRMREPILDDPEHWRRRAEETRRVAEQLDDPVAKQILLDIANSYDQLAKSAEARRASKPAS